MQGFFQLRHTRENPIPAARSPLHPCRLPRPANGQRAIVPPVPIASTLRLLRHRAAYTPTAPAVNPVEAANTLPPPSTLPGRQSPWKASDPDIALRLVRI